MIGSSIFNLPVSMLLSNRLPVRHEAHIYRIWNAELRYHYRLNIASSFT